MNKNFKIALKIKLLSVCLAYIYILFINVGFAQVGNIPSNIKQQISRSGLNNEQIKQIARDSGIDLNDLNEISDPQQNDFSVKNNIKSSSAIQNQLNEINSVTSVVNGMKSENIELPMQDENIFENDEANRDDEIIEDEFVDTNFDKNSTSELVYFGYDIFKNNPDLFQKTENLSVDPNYIIGPGDEIILMLWGETEINKTYIVSIEGYLFIENVGQIFVNGLTMSMLEKKLFKLLKKVYSSLGSPNESGAKTFFDLSLGSLATRPLRVFVLGEVENPGAYSVNSSTTLFSSLFYFNGPLENGSLRKVQLIRDGKIVKTVDIYNYLLNGRALDDERLQRDDIIFISPRGKTVAIKGEINRPAVFELKDSEGLIDLLKISGGLKSTSYMKRAQLNRIVPAEDRNLLNMDRLIIDIELNDLINRDNKNKDMPLYDGDELEIFKISDQIQNSVTINGAVNRPGIYEVKKGMTIIELLSISDGASNDAFLHKVDIFRSSSFIDEEQIVINLKKALDNDPLHNIEILPNDRITIYSLAEMMDKGSVFVEGHVFSPGEKPFYDGMTVNDLLFLGGGFKNKSHLKKTYLERADLFRTDDASSFNQLVDFRLDSLFSDKEKFNFLLAPGDRLVVYSKKDITGDSLKTVEIQGRVKNPGIYELTDSMTVKELFFMSSGFGDKVYYKTVLKKRFDIIRTEEAGNKKNILSYNLHEVLNNDSTNLQIYLKSDDVVRVYSEELVNFSNVISIEGDVVNPGQYNLKDNMTLGDLILESGGVNPLLYGFRAEISRIDASNEDENIYAYLKTFDFENKINIFEQNFNKDINYPLKSDDLVIIRPSPFYGKQEKVSITGYVYYPGDYIISNSEEKVFDIIERAGGLRPEGYALASTLKRNNKVINLDFSKILRSPRSTYNFRIMANDSIIINGRPNLVVVEGEVYNPGNYQFFKGKRLNDYLEMSGGLTRDASKYSSFITYPNGHTKKIKFLNFSPAVVDGSIITVGRKVDVIPFDITQYITNVTSIYSQLMQVYLLLTLSNSNNS